MKITANQVTLLRIICLPLPCFLMYGDTGQRVAALMLFIILGLTDYVDGIMARRDGSTTLGRLLDPIADKIFITVSFVPLMHMGILPAWIVWPIFFREFLVTELRRFTTGSETMKVTDLAKIKTTLQMTGFGLILFNDTFPDKSVSTALLASAFILSGTAWALFRIMKKHVDTRIKKAFWLTLMGLVIILPCPAGMTNIIYGIIILGITMLSGWQYISTGIPLCINQGWKAAASMVTSLFLPLFSLYLVREDAQCSIFVILILSLEFAVQGLDTWAVQEKLKDISIYKKTVVLPLSLAPLIYGAVTGADAACMFLQFAAALLVIYALYDFAARHALLKTM